MDNPKVVINNYEYEIPNDFIEFLADHIDGLMFDANFWSEDVRKLIIEFNRREND